MSPHWWIPQRRIVAIFDALGVLMAAVLVLGRFFGGGGRRRSEGFGDGCQQNFTIAILHVHLVGRRNDGWKDTVDGRRGRRSLVCELSHVSWSWRRHYHHRLDAFPRNTR